MLKDRMKRILLLDNYYGDENNRGLVESIKKCGEYRIDTAMTAEEAFQKSQSTLYDVFIIDASEDVVIRNGRTLGEMLSEQFPNSRRIVWSGQGEIVYDQSLKEVYSAVSRKWLDMETMLALIEGY
jgi:hypothetical protein